MLFKLVDGYDGLVVPEGTIPLNEFQFLIPVTTLKEAKEVLDKVNIIDIG